MSVLAVPLLTGAEIALIAAALVALAAILAALYQLGRLIYQWYWSSSPAAPSPEATRAIQTLQTELAGLTDPDAERPDAARCKELWDLYDVAVSGGVSTLMLNPVREALERICGRP